MTLIEQVQQQLQRQPNTHFLIALSGGLDSTVLLALLAKLRENQPHLALRAIHIHHRLSPNADDWVRHCQQLCQQFSIPLIIEKVQLVQGMGIEAAARQARYQAIARHIKTQEMLLTAHHQQDQTETFFLALKRGSGVSGLSAMKAQSAVFNLRIFRPLLDFSRQQLWQYAIENQLSWIEDESNQDNQYERNFLRNEILPKLRERWANFDQAVQRSATHCAQQQQLLTELLQPELEKYANKTHRTFDLTDFSQWSVLKQNALLRLWLETLQQPMPSTKQLEQLIQDVILAQSDRNPQFQLGDKMLRRYQQRLYLTEIFADLRQIHIPVILNQPLALPDQLGTICFSQTESAIQVQWQNQIYFLPLTNLPISIRFAYSGKVRNAQGIHQDIKKLWQAHNVPVWQRQRTPLIFYGENFQSAVGFFQNFVPAST
ncbi:tRNA lysidine(34) synthetase TilS [Avibacterium sp. 20-129]|uniref:tRNA lysidine(34) synthetase TilS n=1 Tax=Avibacterium sp. 20-129 TaxID=2911525 RepID=UPI002247D7D8|nr:tRNA lysidine(34) synthetase TilS [Avibacterium sp. 20-129]MCW9697962.1 tRNA lysidine(34) synthetase TilS [Avibacterium sp. 20-129]